MKQLWYTIVTSLRDFDLLRFGVAFLIAYTALSLLARLAGAAVAVCSMNHSSEARIREERRGKQRFSGTASRATGAMIGALLGAGRAFVVITHLIRLCNSMMPSGPLTDSIRASAFYNKTAAELLDSGCRRCAHSRAGVDQGSGDRVSPCPAAQVRSNRLRCTG